MADDPLANIQPDATVEPVAPVVPDVPAAPIDPVGDDDKLTESEKAEADEWDAATDELFPGLKKVEDNKKDESTEPKEEIKTPETPKIDPNETPEQKTEREAKETTDSNVAEEEIPEPDEATARLTAREQQAAIDAVKNDVREKMFANVPTELKDADGDPIRSTKDVMNLINPSTGEKFTEDEAILWLGQAERQLERTVKEVNTQIEQIADTNLNVKDQADVINYQYGELLRAMPDVRAKLWAEYEKTLTKDPTTGIITKAPISLRNFYETALEPYAELGRNLENQQTVNTEQAAKAEADAKAALETKKTQTRQDRSDIYGAGKVDTSTDEDKEWDAAAKSVFGDQLLKK